MSGFTLEDVHAITWAKGGMKECFSMDFDPYSSTKVVEMMKTMSYFPRMVLGKSNQGVQH